MTGQALLERDWPLLLSFSPPPIRRRPISLSVRLFSYAGPLANTDRYDNQSDVNLSDRQCTALVTQDSATGSTAAVSRSGGTWILARPGLWLIVCLLLLWEVPARSGFITSTNWPPVSAILVAAVQGLGKGDLMTALGGTLYRMAVGFVLGGYAGILLGVLLSLSRLARQTLEPTVELLRPLPIPALIPPLILFLGLDDPMKIAVVAFTVFFPVFVNTLHGALAIEPTYRSVAATFGASRFATLRSVLLPATLPYVFAGLRVGLGLAFVSAVAAEMVAGDSGIGYYINSMEYAGRGGDMFAALFLVGLCGYLINRGFLAIEHRVLFWHRQSA